MTRKRKNHTPEEKVAVLRRHFVEKMRVSDLRDELGLNTLDLWAAYHRLPIGQAAESLARTFAQGLTSPDESVTEKRNP